MLLGISLLVGIAIAPPAIAEIELRVVALEVADRLQGVMETTAQANANPNAPRVRMTTCRVTVTDATSDSVFLYQEQALLKTPDQPYRQRFLKIFPNFSNQSVESLSSKPANPTALVGFCSKAAGDRVVTQQDLGNPVCSVFLRSAGNIFVGTTPTEGCPTNARGAVRITNRILLYKNGMDTWDRGFDASGKQVWGAKAESYQFRKLE